MFLKDNDGIMLWELWSSRTKWNQSTDPKIEAQFLQQLWSPNSSPVFSAVKEEKFGRNYVVSADFWT